MITEYRLTPAYLLRNLQFKSKFRFLFWTFNCWRYVPNTYVAGCFKETDCPFLYLPFTTSHCFQSFYFEKDAKKWIEKNPNIQNLFDRLKKEYAEDKSVIYF